MKSLAVALLISMPLLSYSFASNADLLGVDEDVVVENEYFSGEALNEDSRLTAPQVVTNNSFEENSPSPEMKELESAAIRTIKGLDHDNDIYANRPYQDLDEDGVADRLDFCHNSKKGYPVDENGCISDSDKDGIYDFLDQCPTTPLGMEVNFLGCEPDDDLDLVLNSLDQCLTTTIGTLVNEVGCNLDDDVDDDNDRDGVSNSRDQCPTTPLGRTVNRFGCESKSIVITNIVFDTGSYNIRYDQRAILDHDIAQLNDTKTDEIIVITGHTDNVGTSARNEQLSWNRAQSVKDYFVDNMNYSEGNIFVLGEGEYIPVASNSTSYGRQENRRIEFSIVKKGSIPARAQLSLPDEMKGYTRYPNR